MTNRDRNYEKMWNKLKEMMIKEGMFPFCRGWVLHSMKSIEEDDEID
jgi:hypothetical protein